MLQRRPCTILEEDVIFCLLPVGVCIDAYVTIRSYVLCASTHHTLATEENVMYESAHVAITFQLLEISSIATPN